MFPLFNTMKLTFLGTGSMIPTKDRNHSGIFLENSGEGLLLDCGEGTQRQLRIAKIRPTRITKILITHWHGDHVLGLPGLIQTLGAMNYDKTLEVYGPIGTKKYLKRMLNSFIMDVKIKFKVIDVKGGKFYESEDYILKSLPLNHSVTCLAYAFIEKDKFNINKAYIQKLGLKPGPLLKDLKSGKDVKWYNKVVKAKNATYLKKGKKIVYVTDTVYFNEISKFAKCADLFICEATLSNELKQKAKEIKHMTAVEAARLAKSAKVKKLVLTHFSQRYKSVTKLKKESVNIFKNTGCAKDFMRLTI